MIRFQRGFFSVVVALFLFAGCQKVQEDKIPPVIRLIGSNPDTILVGCEYHHEGAKVKDDKYVDPDSYTVDGEVNVDSAGVYLLDYTAYDADSNMAFEQRVVVVEELTPDYYEGSYVVTDTLLSVVPRQISVYPLTINRISQNQNLFSISNFNNFGEGFKVLIQPDSLGNFEINYDNNDTLFLGDGWVKCALNGLRMSYYGEIPEESQTHKATYKN